MARRVLVEVSCDICEAAGDAAADTKFSLDGANYKIDLCDDHRSQLDQLLAPYTTVAELVGSRPPRSVVRTRPGTAAAKRPARRDHNETAAIRTWARANGFELADRGRIPGDVEAAYRARSTTASK